MALGRSFRSYAATTRRPPGTLAAFFADHRNQFRRGYEDHSHWCMHMHVVSFLSSRSIRTRMYCVEVCFHGGRVEAASCLAEGAWSVMIDYRHQFSFRHFVGDFEQKQRMQIGNQVMNKLNLLNMTVAYQATPRFSFSVSTPLMFASRRSNNSPYTTTAQGVGDVVLGAQGWIWDPRENTKGNFQFGMGVMLPSGRSNVVNNVDAFDAQSSSTIPSNPEAVATGSFYNGRDTRTLYEPSSSSMAVTSRLLRTRTTLSEVPPVQIH